jgi:hypothetical protein
MRAAVFPDSEAVAVQWLRAAVGVVVATDLNGWQAGQARVVVTRIGGVPSIAYRVDNPRLDVDCYGPDKAAAHDLAQLARARLHELPTGDHTALGAVVAHVRDDVGLQFIPDPDTRAPRYLFTVALAVHPSP